MMNYMNANEKFEMETIRSMQSERFGWKTIVKAVAIASSQYLRTIG